MDELLRDALTLDRRALGQLVTRFEDERAGAAGPRAVAMTSLQDRERAPIIGFTGAPGVGKSTVIAELLATLTADKRVAVIAVDPSSTVSGGSILGDRVRLSDGQLSDNLFYRSQPSEQALGGLSPKTYQVAMLLRRLFDLVVVESVGVGQSEVDICHLADLSLVLLAPGAGDDIQFMKAGLLELPDRFVVNKCDLGAQELLARLRASSDRPISQVSGLTGEGLDDLAVVVGKTPAPSPEADQRRDAFFLAAWVKRQYGQIGLLALDGADSALARDGGYHHAIANFPERMAAHLAAGPH